VKEGEITLCYIYPLIIINFFIFLTSLAWRCDIFSPTILRLPRQSLSSLPLHSGGAWLWGWFSRRRLSISLSCGRFKDGSRIEAPSSLLVTLYNSTTRLNDGIFRVHWFSVVTPARLHQSECVFRFYVYGGTFDNPPGYFLSARGTVFGALCAHGIFGFVGTTGVLPAFVSDFVVWDGLVVYREVGSIPEELLLGQGRVFSI
jgi:hypothetical protein